MKEQIEKRDCRDCFALEGCCCHAPFRKEFWVKLHDGYEVCLGRFVDYLKSVGVVF